MHLVVRGEDLPADRTGDFARKMPVFDMPSQLAVLFLAERAVSEAGAELGDVDRSLDGRGVGGCRGVGVVVGGVVVEEVREW